MSRKDGVISTTLRIDTKTPEGQKAYAFLKKCRKEKKCRSYSELVTNLLSQCYERQSESGNSVFSGLFDSDAFLQAVKESIQDAVRNNEENVIAEMKQLIKEITVSSSVENTKKNNPSKERNDRDSFQLASSFLSEWNCE